MHAICEGCSSIGLWQGMSICSYLGSIPPHHQRTVTTTRWHNSVSMMISWLRPIQSVLSISLNLRGHTSEDGKTSPSEKCKPLPEFSSPDDGAPFPASPGPDKVKRMPSENSQTLAASLGPDNDNSNLSEYGDPTTTSAGPDDSKSNPSQPEAPDNEPLPNCFKCPFCDLICNVKSNLKQHIKRKHKDQQNSTASLHDSGKCLCLEWGFKCHRITDLCQHLTKCHNLSFRPESRTFANYSGKTIAGTLIRKN